MKEKVFELARGIESNVYMKSISGAMTSSMPIMIVSSIASLINAIDFWGIKEFLTTIGVRAILTQLNNLTINVISLYIAFLIAYKLAQNLKANALNSGIIGLLSFLILTPLSSIDTATGTTTTTLDMSAFGSGGMFVAIIGALIGARLYIFLIDKKVTIKMPSSVPPVVSTSFAAIIPAFLVAFLMGGIYYAMSLTSYGSLANLVMQVVQAPIQNLGSNIFAAMFIVAFIEFLWFFGIHGVLAVYPILMLVFYQPGLENLEAFSAGQVLPHLWTMGFILNNRGARSLAVSILCIFKAKSEQLKSVGKIGFIPACFQISEPIKFGIPQVMNPPMLLPLMLTPAVSVLSAYLLVQIGFLPYHNGTSIPTAFPAIFMGGLIQGWQGIVAQLIQLALCIVIYIPFINMQDKIYLEQEKEIATTEELVTE